MRFLIKKNHKKEVTRKGTTVYGTGEEYHSVYEDSISEKRISPTKIKRTTGLTMHDLKSSPVLFDDLKEAYIKNLESVRERIKEVYGEEALDDSNDTFWREKGSVTINNETLTTIFDDENDIDALIFRYNVAGGGFSDIAPSLDCAAVSGRKYYLIEQEEYNHETFEDSVASKLKANAELNNLYTKGSFDALLYISWVCLNDTQGFTRNSSKEVIVSTLSDFIDGKLVNKDKKKCADKFLSLVTAWKNDKETLITEAVFEAAINYGLILMIEGKYTTKARTTVLGSNKQKAIKNLLEAKNIDELKELKQEVDLKLSK